MHTLAALRLLPFVSINNNNNNSEKKSVTPSYCRWFPNSKSHRISNFIFISFRLHICLSPNLFIV